MNAFGVDADGEAGGGANAADQDPHNMRFLQVYELGLLVRATRVGLERHTPFAHLAVDLLELAVLGTNADGEAQLVIDVPGFCRVLKLLEPVLATVAFGAIEEEAGRALKVRWAPRLRCADH